MSGSRSAAVKKSWETRRRSGSTPPLSSSAAALKNRALRLDSDLKKSFKAFGIQAVPFPRGITAKAAGVSGFGSRTGLLTGGSYPITPRRYGGVVRGSSGTTRRGKR